MIGPSFAVGDLAPLLSALDNSSSATAAALDQLEARNLLRRRPPSREAGGAEFRFKHALICDVAHASLTRSDRRAAHASLARHLEAASDAQDPDLPWRLAHHWEEAGEAQDALRWLLVAARRAGEAMAAEDAANLYARALRLAPDDATRRTIRPQQALSVLGFEDFEPAWAELEELLPELTGRDRLESLLGLACAGHWTERTSEVLAGTAEAIELANKATSAISSAPRSPAAVPPWRCAAVRVTWLAPSRRASGRFDSGRPRRGRSIWPSTSTCSAISTSGQAGTTVPSSSTTHP